MYGLVSCKPLTTVRLPCILYWRQTGLDLDIKNPEVFDSHLVGEKSAPLPPGRQPCQLTNNKFMSWNEQHQRDVESTPRQPTFPCCRIMESLDWNTYSFPLQRPFCCCAGKTKAKPKHRAGGLNHDALGTDCRCAERDLPFEWVFSNDKKTDSVVVNNDGKDLSFHPTYRWWSSVIANRISFLTTQSISKAMERLFAWDNRAWTRLDITTGRSEWPHRYTEQQLWSASPTINWTSMLTP